MPYVSRAEARRYNLLTEEAPSRNYYARGRNTQPRAPRPRRERVVARFVDAPSPQVQAQRHLDYLKGVRDGAYMMIDDKRRSFHYVRSNVTAEQLLRAQGGVSNDEYHDLKHTEKFLVADHAYETYKARLQGTSAPVSIHPAVHGAQR